MKLDYLEMLHADFEVSSLNSMAVGEIIRLDYKQIRKTSFYAPLRGAKS